MVNIINARSAGLVAMHDYVEAETDGWPGFRHAESVAEEAEAASNGCDGEATTAATPAAPITQGQEPFIIVFYVCLNVHTAY